MYHRWNLYIIDLKRVVAYIYEHIKIHTTCQINYKFQETFSFILFCQCLIRNWSIDTLMHACLLKSLILASHLFYKKDTFTQIGFASNKWNCCLSLVQRQQSTNISTRSVIIPLTRTLWYHCFIVVFFSG